MNTICKFVSNVIFYFVYFYWVSQKGFEMKIVKVRYKLREIYCFEVEHKKFYKPNFGDFWIGNLVTWIIDHSKAGN